MNLTYGFTLLLKKNINNITVGKYYSISLIILSLEILVVSNIIYTNDILILNIDDAEKLSILSLFLYLVLGVLPSILIYILSTPHRFLRAFKSSKEIIFSILIGIGIFIAINIIILIIYSSLFGIDYIQNSDSYKLLISSIILGFGGFSSFFIIIRTKQFYK